MRLKLSYYCFWNGPHRLLVNGVDGPCSHAQAKSVYAGECHRSFKTSTQVNIKRAPRILKVEIKENKIIQNKQTNKQISKHQLADALFQVWPNLLKRVFWPWFIRWLEQREFNASVISAQSYIWWHLVRAPEPPQCTAKQLHGVGTFTNWKLARLHFYYYQFHSHCQPSQMAYINMFLHI